MSWPLSLAVVLGAIVVLVLFALQRWPRSLLLELTVTAILTLAVLIAMGLAWSALWWFLQRWWAS